MWLEESHTLSEDVTTPIEQNESVRMSMMPTLHIAVRTRTHISTYRDTVVNADGSSLYPCPIYMSLTAKQRLEDPILILHVPAIDHASVLIACGTAMFLRNEVNE